MKLDTKAFLRGFQEKIAAGWEGALRGAAGSGSLGLLAGGGIGTLMGGIHHLRREEGDEATLKSDLWQPLLRGATVGGLIGALKGGLQGGLETPVKRRDDSDFDQPFTIPQGPPVLGLDPEWVEQNKIYLQDLNLGKVFTWPK